jgi:hypothetical protein
MCMPCHVATYSCTLLQVRLTDVFSRSTSNSAHLERFSKDEAESSCLHCTQTEKKTAVYLSQPRAHIARSSDLSPTWSCSRLARLLTEAYVEGWLCPCAASSSAKDCRRSCSASACLPYVYIPQRQDGVMTRRTLHPQQPFLESIYYAQMLLSRKKHDPVAQPFPHTLFPLSSHVSHFHTQCSS